MVSDVPPRRAAATREAILDTAAKIFMTRGYEQSSMDDIAVEAGVARRTLYNHFDSKTALFDATLTRMWASMPLDAVVDSTAEVRQPEEVLCAIGRMIADFWAPPEAISLTRLVIWESARLPELAETFWAVGREPARRAVSHYVSRLSRLPGFAIADVDLATAQFIDVILGEVLLGRLVTAAPAPLGKDRCDYIVGEAVTLFMTRYRRHP